MTNQEIIDKYLSEFNDVQRMQVPIELNPYLHRMINEALRIHDVVWRSEQLKALLEKLLNENMCSVVGDELIEEALKGF